MSTPIKLFFAGDFCSKPSSSFINVETELRALIQSCDFSVINFEVPLKPNVELPKQSRERFFQNDDVPAFLKSLGFNLFSLANNHAFDWNEEGFIKTKSILGEDAFGAGSYEEAYRVKIVESFGIKIGFLALSFAAYKGVFQDVLDHNGMGCAYINDLKVNHVIIDARQKVDYLFIVAHDGIEYIDAPLPETIARYRDFIDYGADGVIASHPHCPQGWEVYKGKPIFYSLGNFFFNSKNDVDFHCTKPHWYEGRCVIISINDGDLSWEVVNTLNVENRQLVIDRREDSQTHNTAICNFLLDNKSYTDYLNVQLKKEYLNHINKIDITFHQKNLGQSLAALWKCIKAYIKKRPDSSDKRLKPLFRHDLFRYTMLRMIK